MRAIRFVPDAWDACLYGQDQDKKTLKRIKLLITAAARDPFVGIGHPEPLRGDLSGYGLGVSMTLTGWCIAQSMQSWSLLLAASTMAASVRTRTG